MPTPTVKHRARRSEGGSPVRAVKPMFLSVPSVGMKPTAIHATRSASAATPVSQLTSKAQLPLKLVIAF